jgi:hypothetical protein
MTATILGDAAFAAIIIGGIAAFTALAAGAGWAWDHRPSPPRRARREYPPLCPHIPMPPGAAYERMITDAKALYGLLRDDREPVAIAEFYACGCLDMHDTNGTQPIPCSDEHNPAFWESMERMAGQ